MEMSLVLTMIAIFTSVALVVGSLTYVSLERSSPQTRRLRDLLRPRSARHAGASDLTKLNEAPGKVLSKIGTFIPKSPKTMGKLQRRLALAGLYKGSHAVWYNLAEVGCTVTGYVPGVTFAATLICNADVSVAPVSGVGVNVPVIPVGGVTRLRAISDVRFVRTMVMLELLLAPGAMVRVVGAAEIVNVPAAATTTVNVVVLSATPAEVPLIMSV